MLPRWSWAGRCSKAVPGLFFRIRPTVAEWRSLRSSAVLNGSSQIVGQLSGICGTNVNDPCDKANNATVDGAFAFTATQSGVDESGNPFDRVTLTVGVTKVMLVPALPARAVRPTRCTYALSSNGAS